MFVESISQRSGQNNPRSRGERIGNKDGGILFVNTSLAWSTVNRTPHTGGEGEAASNSSCLAEGLQQKRRT